MFKLYITNQSCDATTVFNIQKKMNINMNMKLNKVTINEKLPDTLYAGCQLNKRS